MDDLTKKLGDLNVDEVRVAQERAFADNAEFVQRLNLALSQIQRFANISNVNGIPELKAHAQGLVTIANQMDAQVPADQAKYIEGRWDQALDSLKTAWKSFATAVPGEASLWITSELSTLKSGADTMTQAEFANSHEVLSDLAQSINEGLATHDDFKDSITKINQQVKSFLAEEN